jgi:mono/diheme cytochrome c family protein
MALHRLATVPALIVLALGPVILPASADEQKGHSHQLAPPPSSIGAPAPAAPSVRMTMEQLHAVGGVPPGWRFALPPGDAAAGRKVFVDLKCYACHAVRGEQFPLTPGESPTGPDLTGMGSHHPAEYLGESVVNPSAVVLEGRGWVGGDGRSTMPAYRDLTVGQLLDLVAYLGSLKAPHGDAAAARTPPRIKELGPFTVRLEFKPRGQPPAPGSDRAGELMVFVADRISGQPIPYLNVFARLDIAGQPGPGRLVKLNPALGREGPLYMADVSIPPEARQIGLTVGPMSARVQPGMPEWVRQLYTVNFDWP